MAPDEFETHPDDEKEKRIKAQIERERTAPAPSPAGPVSVPFADSALRANIGYFAFGLVLAGLANLTFVSRFVVSFIGTLTHELGHVLMAFAFGAVAVPALYITGGGKAAIIADSGMVGVAVIGAILTVLAFMAERHYRWLALAAVVGYFAIGFSGGKVLMFDAGGHVGESIWVAVCFYRCLVAGDVQKIERVLYVLSGGWLAGRQIALFWGLRFIPQARVDYISELGAMGLTPDLLKISLAGAVSMETVAAGFLILSIFPFIGVFLLALRRRAV